MGTFATIPGGVPTLEQLNALLPLATTVPPAVSDTGAVGGTSSVAPGDHTHPSKARKQRVAVSTALFTWTFPTAFSAGVVPICNGIAESPGTTDLINVQIEGTPTNTQCVFRITRYGQSVASLLGLTVLALNTSPATIMLHATAFQP